MIVVGFMLALFLLLALLPPLAQKQQHAGRSPGDEGRRSSSLPSPPRLPVIGHLHRVSFRRPHASLRGLDAAYGRDGLLLVHLGTVPTLVVSSPGAAAAVLRTHDRLLASRPPCAAARALLRGSLDVAFAAYGDDWRLARKILTVHMLAGKKVASRRPCREEVARLAVARVAAAAAAGQALDVSELLYSSTTDMVCRAVSTGFLKLDGRSKRFRELLDATAALVGGVNLDHFFPFLLRLRVFRRSIQSKADMLRKAWDNLLDSVIDEHEGKLQLHQQEPGFLEDLMSHQQEYGLTRDQIKDLLIDIFFGGTDTSFKVLESIMMELTRKPAAMRKLQEELRNSSVPQEQLIITEEDLQGMAYLKAVIKEALRLHPPAPLLAPHMTMAGVDIKGYKVPAGLPVLINAWAIGRDASLWDHAQEFMPERFLGTGLSFEGRDFQFLPFGAGRRGCPGVNFAVSTIEIMAANLIRSFNWEVPGGSRVREEAGVEVAADEAFCLTVDRKEHLMLVPSAVPGVNGSN
ncbi:hypothetical protein ACP70R_045141 [Stipagrostis hirtigluma subsp. patula]